MKKNGFIPLESLSIRERSLLWKIYEAGSIPRNDLKRIADVKNGTYYNSIEQLLSSDMVYKETDTPVGKGRPSEKLVFNKDYCNILYLFISKGLYSIALLDLYGNTIDKKEFELGKDTTRFEVIEKATQFFNEKKQQFNIPYLMVISGINRKRANSFKVHPSLIEKSLRNELEEKTGLKGFSETIARAAAEGIYLSGNKENDSFIFLNISSGIGIGIVDKGQVLNLGQDNRPNIEHFTVMPEGKRCKCGQKGCIVTYAGTANILQDVKHSISLGLDSSLSDSLDLHFRDIVNAANDGDRLCRDAMDDAAVALKVMMHNLSMIFQPKNIILGGTLLKNNHYLMDKLREGESEQPVFFEENYGEKTPIGAAYRLMETLLSTENGVIKG